MILFVCLVVCTVLQTTPHLFQFGQVKLVFILPLCIAVAIQEGEFAGALFGVAGGLMWDYAAGRVVGMFGLGFLVLCFAVSILVQLYLRESFLNYFMIACVTNFIVLSMDFLLFYWMPSYAHPSHVYLMHTLPVVLGSAVTAMPIFWLVRKIEQKFDL